MGHATTVGIIGLGQASWLYDLSNPDQIISHTKSLRSLTNYKLLFGIDTELTRRLSWSKEFELPSFEELRMAHDFEPDLLIIATPIVSLFETLLEALMTFPKSRILVEKPVCSELEQLEVLEKLDSVSKNRVVVNFPRLFQPETRDMKELIRPHLGGGGPIEFSGTYSGGALNTLGHFLSLLEFLLGHLSFNSSNPRQDAQGRRMVDLEICSAPKNIVRGFLHADPTREISTANFIFRTPETTIKYIDGGDKISIQKANLIYDIPTTRETYQLQVYKYLAAFQWESALEISGLATQLPIIRRLLKIVKAGD